MFRSFFGRIRDFIELQNLFAIIQSTCYRLIKGQQYLKKNVWNKLWWLIWRDVFPYPIFCHIFEGIWIFGIDLVHTLYFWILLCQKNKSRGIISGKAGKEAAFTYISPISTTLESGIDVGQGITVGPGKFVKKNKHSALNKHRAWTKCAKLCYKKPIKLENISRPWKKFQNLINVGPLIRL